MSSKQARVFFFFALSFHSRIGTDRPWISDWHSIFCMGLLQDHSAGDRSSFCTQVSGKRCAFVVLSFASTPFPTTISPLLHSHSHTTHLQWHHHHNIHSRQCSLTLVELWSAHLSKGLPTTKRNTTCLSTIST